MRFSLLAALSATGYCSCKLSSASHTGWGFNSTLPVSGSGIPGTAVSQSAAPQSATPTTWFSTSYVGAEDGTLRIIQYGSTAVTPVPTSSLAGVIEETTITEPTASSDISQTVFVTETATVPVVTDTVFIPATSRLPPHSKLVNSTTTSYEWVSPTVATVTFTQTPVPDACLTQEVTTVTEYTGTYTPLPDQNTDPKTRFPTAVLTQLFNTVTYRLYPFTGTTVTETITETETAALSTATITVTQSEDAGRYTSTHYASTVTATRSDFQLAYTTVTATPSASDSSCAATKTVTLAQKCAPTNLLSETDGLGVAIRILPNEWSFPIGFSDTLLGIPGGLNRSADSPPDGLTIRDASSCCQLCVDNPGCAGSEWAVEDTYNGSCRLYWYNDPADGEGNFDGETVDPDTGAVVVSHGERDTCGKRVDGLGQGGEEDTVGLQYYGNPFKLPGQASYVQVGCGRLMYVGEMDPWF